MAAFLATTLQVVPAEVLPLWPHDSTGLCLCQELFLTDLCSEPVILLGI